MFYCSKCNIISWGLGARHCTDHEHTNEYIKYLGHAHRNLQSKLQALMIRNNEDTFLEEECIDLNNKTAQEIIEIHEIIKVTLI